MTEIQLLLKFTITGIPGKIIHQFLISLSSAFARTDTHGQTPRNTIPSSPARLAPWRAGNYHDNTRGSVHSAVIMTNLLQQLV